MAEDLYVLPPMTRRQLDIIYEGIRTGIDWHAYEDEEEAEELNIVVEEALHCGSDPVIVE